MNRRLIQTLRRELAVLEKKAQTLETKAEAAQKAADRAFLECGTIREMLERLDAGASSGPPEQKTEPEGARRTGQLTDNADTILQMWGRADRTLERIAVVRSIASIMGTKPGPVSRLLTSRTNLAHGHAVNGGTFCDDCHIETKGTPCQWCGAKVKL